MTAPVSPTPSRPTAPARPAEPTFVEFLGQIDENRFASQCTEELEVLVEGLRRIAQIPNTKPKGKFTIEIVIAAQPGGEILTVTPEIKVRPPKPPRGTSTFWRTRSNMLSAVSPHQIDLPLNTDAAAVRPGDVRTV